ncbi:unnamed protein product [Amoebophrya sp. A120]|nr:unnamed protein product [Amoebophrya sp. A120]|eukprot:GSA120T00017637001.1
MRVTGAARPYQGMFSDANERQQVTVGTLATVVHSHSDNVNNTNVNNSIDAAKHDKLYDNARLGINPTTNNVNATNSVNSKKASANFPSRLSQEQELREAGARGRFLCRAYSVPNKGKSHPNEDRFFCEEHIVNPPSTGTDMFMVGVMDGHDGAKCAQLVADELPSTVMQQLFVPNPNGGAGTVSREELLAVERERQQLPASPTTGHGADAIHNAHVQAFQKLEQRMFDRRKQDTSGCCVNSVAVYRGTVYCSNLGDCRAVYIPLGDCRDFKAGANPASPLQPSTPVAANTLVMQETSEEHGQSDAAMPDIDHDAYLAAVPEPGVLVRGFTKEMLNNDAADNSSLSLPGGLEAGSLERGTTKEGPVQLAGGRAQNNLVPSSSSPFLSEEDKKLERSQSDTYNNASGTGSNLNFVGPRSHSDTRISGVSDSSANRPAVGRTRIAGPMVSGFLQLFGFGSGGKKEQDAAATTPSASTTATSSTGTSRLSGVSMASSGGATTPGPPASGNKSPSKINDAKQTHTANLALAPLGELSYASNLRLGKFSWLSRDFRAGKIYERNRMRAIGFNQVINGRICGCLEPSRTIGDLDIKLQIPPGVISIIPETRAADMQRCYPNAFSHPRDKHYQGIIIQGTDGLWDGLNGDDICQALIAKTEGILKMQRYMLEASDNNFDPDHPEATKLLEDLACNMVQTSYRRPDNGDDVTLVITFVSWRF